MIYLLAVAGSPIVDRCMSGFNVSLFAYGQTSAGKTHTMTGDLSNPEQVLSCSAPLAE